MTEDQVRLLELDIAEPLADMIRRAEQAAETPAHHAEFNVTAHHGGTELFRVNRARFVTVNGVLSMVRPFSFTVDHRVERNSISVAVRESVSDVAIARDRIAHDACYPGDEFTVTTFTVGVPD